MHQRFTLHYKLTFATWLMGSYTYEVYQSFGCSTTSVEGKDSSLILSYLLYFVLLEAILFVQLAFEFGTFRLQQHKPYFFSKYIYSVKSNIARLPTVCWSTLRDLSESPEVCWIPILIYFWWFDDTGGTLESDENLCFCFTYV